MSEQDQEIRRVEDWLTGGKPRIIRTRSSIRARAASATTPHRATVCHLGQFEEVLGWLQAEAPGMPWVVIVDGSVNELTEGLCAKVLNYRPSAKFWLVSRGAEEPDARLMPAQTKRLNPDEPRDERLLQNLVADLVIATAEPLPSQSERLERWLPRARYVLTDGV